MLTYLPAAVLEGHALTTLRLISLYATTRSTDRSALLPDCSTLAVTLRAVGWALECRHGAAWPQLLEESQRALRESLDQPSLVSTTHVFLSLQTLKLIYELKHGPTDVQLAQTNLGKLLISMAVGMEHLLVLSSDPTAPGPLSLVHRLSPPQFSRREQTLLQVAQHLAALELRASLPRGHQVTPVSLQALAMEVRRTAWPVVREPSANRDPVMSHMTSRPGHRFQTSAAPEERLGIVALSDCLLRSLLTADDHPQVRKHDNKLAAALEKVEAQLVAEVRAAYLLRPRGA